MELIITLQEASNRVNNWNKFCEWFGFDVYVCNEGGGHIEVTMNEDEMIKFGIINGG